MKCTVSRSLSLIPHPGLPFDPHLLNKQTLFFTIYTRDNQHIINKFVYSKDKMDMSFVWNKVRPGVLNLALRGVIYGSSYMYVGRLVAGHCTLDTKSQNFPDSLPLKTSKFR